MNPAGETLPTPTCQQFEVRLTNQSTYTDQDSAMVVEGNVESCLNGTYFAICDVGWDDVEAQVICNALGYGTPLFRKLHWLWGLGDKTNIHVCQIHSGGVAMDGLTPTAQVAAENVMCPINATSGFDCSFVSPPTTPRCYDNSSAAGVRCVQGQ